MKHHALIEILMGCYIDMCKINLDGKQLTERRLFSNFGEFILHVVSQGFVSGSSLLTLLNPATNYFFSFNFFVSDFQVFVSHAFQDLKK